MSARGAPLTFTGGSAFAHHQQRMKKGHKNTATLKKLFREEATQRKGYSAT